MGRWSGIENCVPLSFSSVAIGAFARRALRLARDELVEATRDGANMLAPRLCLVCNRGAEQGLFCAEHALGIGPDPPRCGRCDGPLPGSFPDGERCATCRREPRGPSRTLALGDYRDSPSLRECVLALKHGGRRDLADPLAALLALRWQKGLAHLTGDSKGVWRPLAPREIFVPVPLHPFRRLERGYDQAQLLARALADHLGLHAAWALKRTSDSLPQGSPGCASRAANVRGLFRVRWRQHARVRGAHVWLVDDVVTSGATLEECARALRRAGAKAVDAIVLAHAGGRGSGGVADAER